MSALAELVSTMTPGIVSRNGYTPSSSASSSSSSSSYRSLPFCRQNKILHRQFSSLFFFSPPPVVVVVVVVVIRSRWLGGVPCTRGILFLHVLFFLRHHSPFVLSPVRKKKMFHCLSSPPNPFSSARIALSQHRGADCVYTTRAVRKHVVLCRRRRTKLYRPTRAELWTEENFLFSRRRLRAVVSESDFKSQSGHHKPVVLRETVRFPPPSNGARDALTCTCT